MPVITARQFIDALARLERDDDVEPLAALHAPDATLSNPQITVPPGPDAPRRFWRAYRDSFARIESSFHAVVEGADAVMLEWESDGEMAGRPVRYRGVTVLEIDGDGIAAVRTYFDPAALGAQISGTAH